MRAHGRFARSRRRRGLLLPIVLLIVAMLSLVAAGFGFMARAEYRAMASQADQYQARLTAEAGVQRVMLMLRTERNNMTAWWNDEEILHNSVVWLPGIDPARYGPQTEIEKGQPAWRFSIVADDANSDEPESVRYGITDEASKLNLNEATAEQLTRLFSEFVPPETDVEELVDAVLDWRDADDDVRPKGAESPYYELQKPPTRCKNGPFESVEELLLVRGITAEILYGEDYNRNGILDPDEDDGEDNLPVDNADGELNRGLYPYLTIYSRDLNTANDNRPRINFMVEPAEQLQPELEEFFGPEVVQFILDVKQAGTQIETPAELYGLQTDGDPPLVSPITADDLPEIMNRLTTAATPVFPDSGHTFPAPVDVNTAPAPVLRAIGIADEDVANIITTREELTAEQKQTIAWLVTNAGLSREAFIEAAKKGVTARGMQFHIESVGYAEHVGAFSRLETIIELRGQAAAILYLRDLTSLGMGYPVRLKFGEGAFARQTSR